MKIYSLMILVSLTLFSCASNPSNQQSTDNLQAFTGATIIDGNGGEPIQNGVMLLRNGRIVQIGTKDNVTIPTDVKITDLSGKTIVPGIINGHGHVGEVIGIEGGHYSAGTIENNLNVYAQYGVTTVISLGGDKQQAEPYRYVHDSVGKGRARLFIAGKILENASLDSDLSELDSNQHMGTDLVKIRVDDQLGTATKMPQEVFTPLISKAHDSGFKVAAHMYYSDDARKLVDAGVDMLAHSIRDKQVDESVIQAMKAKHTFYCPTLTRELSTFVYADSADFFNDPFFARGYDSKIIAPLLDPARQQKMRDSKSAMTYKKQLPVAMANLKSLSDQGVPIVLGTDSGVPTRFMGYFEHVEMTMMVEAGMTPMQVIVSSSKTPAEFLNLKDLGTLTPGHWADFLVLDASPLENIKNYQKLSAVFIGGESINKTSN